MDAAVAVCRGQRHFAAAGEKAAQRDRAAGDLQTAKDTAGAIEEKTKVFFEEKKYSRRLLFIRSDEAPIAYIENRFRAQVLMKLLNHPDSEQAIAELSEWTFRDEKGTRVCFEVNPASLA